MKISLPIIKKLNTKIFHQKLLKAVTVITYRHHKSSKSEVIKYRVYGKFHKEYGPAHILMDSGVKSREEWYWNGKNHRVDGPAITSYQKSFGGFLEAWYIQGVLHRTDGPAYLSHEIYHGGYYERWYRNGILHRDGGPAFIDHSPYFHGYREYWYKNGILHRTDGPAEITGSGDFAKSRWYIDGRPSAIGYCQDLKITVQNSPANTIAKQRKWINLRIQAAKKFGRSFIKIRPPLCEEILRELELIYYLEEPRMDGFDARHTFNRGVLTVRFDRDPHNFNISGGE